ncbi:MAG TPA: delta-60 repeat domain-containing protein [Verrucomicrobiae bacterium]|nr:delta-60 repeat domain-containing protein [Verrucomicrobiae bacterium]
MQYFRFLWRVWSGLHRVCLLCTFSSATAFSAQPGSIDLSFDAHLSTFAAVYILVAQPDGKILIGGAFQSVGEVARANVARLNSDGTLDPTFNPGTAVDTGYVTAIAVDQFGRILLGGNFSSSDYSAPNNLARLNSDGSVDYSLDPGLYVDGAVNALALQDEDYIVIAGAFFYVNGYPRQNVARLYQDGSLDFAFDACVAATSGVGASALALLPDGHILVTGKFTFAGNQRRDGIARLESCGDLDASYASQQPGINTNAEVYCLGLLTNGNALLGGSFVLYNEQSRSGIMELDPNGALLPGFDPGSGVLGETIYALSTQVDQKIIIGGTFSEYNGTPVSNIARLNPDGSLDSSFNPGTGPDDAVSSFLLLPDRRLLVAGRFSSFDGVPRIGLVKLHGDLSRGLLGQPVNLPNGQWRFTFHGEEGTRYTIQTSSNFVDWNTLVKITAPESPLRITDPATTLPLRFYRAISAP